MAVVTIEGTVLAHRPLPSGKWTKVVLIGTEVRNVVVMATGIRKLAQGETFSAVVDPATDQRYGGILYWERTPAPASAAS